MVISSIRLSAPLRIGLILAGGLFCILTVGRAGYRAYASAGLADAARTGQIDSADYWLAHGANINARDKFGDTPLMYAARNAHPAAVRYLLSHGAKMEMRDSFGLNATQWATFHLRDSRMFHRPEGIEVKQVPRPEAKQTLALLTP